MELSVETDSVSDLVIAAQAGDVVAYGKLVRATQAMSLAVALSVLRERAGAEDAVQEAYLRAYRTLRDLQDPAAFAGWLRRVVITVALNLRRTHRVTLLSLDDVPSVPVLDENESHWSEGQRHRLAAALLTLSADERRICDRRYHGGWSVARLAQAAGMPEATLRKRLQRIRDRLRQFIEAEEMEMMKERGVDPGTLAGQLPGKIVELLASPPLTDLPENPVGRMRDREKLDPWQLTGRVLQSVDRTLPGRAVKIMSVQYPMCSRAWEVEVDDNGEWIEVLAFGIFTDRIVSHVGGDPTRHIAMGVGYGLERFAMLRYGINDIRRIDVARVA